MKFIVLYFLIGWNEMWRNFIFSFKILIIDFVNIIVFMYKFFVNMVFWVFVCKWLILFNWLVYL